VITALLLSTALLAGADTDQGLADLAARLEIYMDMRRSVARTVPPLTVTHDRAATIAAADALAQAIVRARADARPGDIFTPPVAAALRRAIVDGCPDGLDELRRAIAPEHEVDAPLPVAAVHARWPVGAPLPTMPPDLLEALPRLPPALEYRFVGSALVLRDIDANLIVDVVADVIPPITAP
jgi:hypothetical protein